MNKVNLDFTTGSINNFGHKTHINLHERRLLNVARSLHNEKDRRATFSVNNENWDLTLFIDNAETARTMANYLTEIADFMEDNDV